MTSAATSSAALGLSGEKPRPSQRIDPGNVQRAIRICEYILSRLESKGRYLPEEALYFESIGYQSSLAAYLAAAGKLLEEKRYIKAAKLLLDEVQRHRLGDLWPVGCWVAFPIYRPIPVGWRENFLSTPDLRYSALVAAALGVYHRASGDDQVIEPARRALQALVSNWNFQEDKERVLHLSFEVLAMAIAFWEHALPQFSQHKRPILDWVLQTFVKQATQDFPFLTMYRTMLVLATTGRQHLETHILLGIDALLRESRWRCAENTDDFFHSKDTADHVNIRANGAIAITLRLVDIAAQGSIYGESAVYQNVTRWMEGQRRGDGAYYGCREHRQGRRFCLGSPAQYLPLCWMIGGLAIEPA